MHSRFFIFVSVFSSIACDGDFPAWNSRVADIWERDKSYFDKERLPIAWFTEEEYIPTEVDERSSVYPEYMNTYEKFKRQAVKVSVPGDEFRESDYSGFSTNLFRNVSSWKTATIIGVLCIAAAVFGVILALVILQKTALHDWSRAWLRSGSDAGRSGHSSGFGITASTDEAADRALAHSVQMYHFQQQKQQMLAMDKAAGKIENGKSDQDTDEDVEELDVNVYECPGLASADGAEVINPFFREEQIEHPNEIPSSPNQ